MLSFSWTITPSDQPVVTGTVQTPEQAAGANALRDEALDENGDIYLDPATGDMVWVSGAAGVASDLLARLQTWLGEYYWNTGIGFPWLQVLGEKPPAATVEALVRREALATPGITEVRNFVMQGVGRDLTISFEAIGDLGQVFTASLAALGVEQEG